MLWNPVGIIRILIKRRLVFPFDPKLDSRSSGADEAIYTGSRVRVVPNSFSLKLLIVVHNVKVSLHPGVVRLYFIASLLPFNLAMHVQFASISLIKLSMAHLLFILQFAFNLKTSISTNVPSPIVKHSFCLISIKSNFKT